MTPYQTYLYLCSLYPMQFSYIQWYYGLYNKMPPHPWHPGITPTKLLPIIK